MAKQRSVRILTPWGDESRDKEPRNFYIWGFQLHFEIDVKLTARQLFKRLDEALLPDTFIVAVNSDERSEYPFAVVEPDDHEFKKEDFASVLKLAAEFGKISPGPELAYPADSKWGEEWAKQQERRAFRSRIREAIKQTVVGACRPNSKRVYVSPGREFGPYIVHAVLLLDEAACKSHPTLRRTTRDEYSLVTSLVDAVANKFMETCWEAILSSFAGDGLVEFPSVDSLLTAAGTSFMYTPFGACGEWMGVHGGFEICTEISTLTYEKTARRSRLILARRGHESLVESLAFRNPPKLRNYRAVRKLLQLADESEGLVCDSVHILGIGTIHKDYVAANEDLFCVEFLGHAKWELIHDGHTLMRVEHGVPKLPMKRMQIQRFGESFARLFPAATDKQKASMTRLATAATELSHGAIVIVVENADEEAARFGSQSTMIEPQSLSAELLEKASRIDGAILVSPDGICHAVGVILDGHVSDKGTANRGARYNSTVRYVLGSNSRCLGLVVSDDGMVDIVPEYRPLMSRREIEQKLNLLRNLVGQSSVDQRAMNKIADWIKDHEFYLSELQCDEMNRLLAEAKPKSDGSGAWVVYKEFKRHPEMNDSFLCD